MRSLHLVLLSLLVVSPMVLSSQSARADEQCSECSESYHHHYSIFNVSVSPRYYALNSNGYNSAFSNAGVSSPSSGEVGVDFSLFFNTASRWQIGVAFGSVNFENDNGAQSAGYNDQWFGVWLGKGYQINDLVDISVGSVIGWGNARTEIVTTGVSGRTDENAFILQPKLIAAYRVAPWLKVGVSGAYMEPIGASQSIKGNQLTTGNISLHGASGGVEFIIGRFAAPEHHDDSKKAD